jgi:hypothetical protein
MKNAVHEARRFLQSCFGDYEALRRLQAILSTIQQFCAVGDFELFGSPESWKSSSRRTSIPWANENDIQISLPSRFIWKTADATKSTLMRIDTPNLNFDRDAFCRWSSIMDP